MKFELVDLCVCEGVCVRVTLVRVRTDRKQRRFITVNRWVVTTEEIILRWLEKDCW